ncbi:MAG: hypothetical protein K6C94_07575 [Candidatus Gastranaerophilales bacterium]|nr:hypothetical protein [Candidatus Gastranaerophilales bacterium]
MTVLRIAKQSEQLEAVKQKPRPYFLSKYRHCEGISPWQSFFQKTICHSEAEPKNPADLNFEENQTNKIIKRFFAFPILIPSLRKMRQHFAAILFGANAIAFCTLLSVILRRSRRIQPI